MFERIARRTAAPGRTRPAAAPAGSDWLNPTLTGQPVSSKAVVRTGTNDLVGPDPRGVL